MAGTRRNDMHRNAAAQQMRDVRVPQAVKGDFRNAGVLDRAAKFPREVNRNAQITVMHGENEIELVLSKTEAEPMLKLFLPVEAKLLNEASGERDGSAATIGFRLFDRKARLRL